MGKYEVEYRIVDQTTHEHKHVHVRGETKFDPDGKPILVRGTLQDVSDRAHVRSSFEESELWLWSLFDRLQGAVLIVTLDRRIIASNLAAEKIFGYARRELRGEPTEVLQVDPDHHHEFDRRIQAAFDRGETVEFEFQAKRNNGKVFPTHHTVTLLTRDNGQAFGIVSVIRVLTEADRSGERADKD